MRKYLVRLTPTHYYWADEQGIEREEYARFTVEADSDQEAKFIAINKQMDIGPLKDKEDPTIEYADIYILDCSEIDDEGNLIKNASNNNKMKSYGKFDY